MRENAGRAKLHLPPAVLRGETMRLQVAASRRGTVLLSQRIPGAAWTTQTVNVDQRTGIATIEVGPLRGDLSVVATDGRSVSDTVLVKVTDRPFVGAVAMRATYPQYLGRAAENLAAGEPARVPQGTIIDTGRLRGVARRAPRHQRECDDTVSLRVSDHFEDVSRRAKRADMAGWRMDSPVPSPMCRALELGWCLTPRRVELVSPAIDTLVAGDDKITLRATASDDHGISRVDLVSWKQGSTGGVAPAVTQRLADGSSPVWDGTALLDLGPRGPKPGDEPHRKIVATATRRGPSTEKVAIAIKIPTMESAGRLPRVDGFNRRPGPLGSTGGEGFSSARDASRDRNRNSADAPSRRPVTTRAR